jgi:AraC family transcriptional regulator of adaptative response/methylated-DNA-[protein]-cysteine methyltransferase
MIGHDLPPRDEMVDAFLRRDAAYEGVFFTGVRTTGIFCRPVCAARKPNPENVEFFATCRDALLAGYRPCKRCAPMEPPGDAPEWLRPLLDRVEAEPARRWRDAELRQMGLDPGRVRRWFRAGYGMTFHAYSRSRRLGEALGQIRRGEQVARSAFDAGYDSLSGFQEAFRKLAGDAPTARKDAPVVKVTRIPTPLGPVVAGATDEAVCLLEFADRRMLPTQLGRLQRRLGAVLTPGDSPLLAELQRELDEYFAGRRLDFDVPIVAAGTPFQERVWAELRKIRAGETMSYAELARRIGRPTAVRAVARANGDNRVAILIPCHRVVGSDGKLTGYGGGLWRKQRLLDLERGARA